jgi:hypothetical protein
MDLGDFPVFRGCEAGLDERHVLSDFEVSVVQQSVGHFVSVRDREDIARTPSMSNTEALSCSVLRTSESNHGKPLDTDLTSSPALEQTICTPQFAAILYSHNVR